ncbi:MAG: RsmD family RNA methyltransferase, partial [Alphaproteobacteria bacterium]
PPWGEELAPRALAALRDQGWLAPGAIACVETGDRERCDPPEGFEPLDERRHGRATVAFMRLVARAG